MCYYFHYDSRKSFDDALQECQIHEGGSLAIIRTQEENDFLSEALFAIDGKHKLDNIFSTQCDRLLNIIR